MSKSLLGIDIGLTRTGIALSESGLIATPLAVLQADPPHFNGVLNKLVDFIREYNIETVVVGLPLTREGVSTTQSNKVLSLLERLEKQAKQAGLSPTYATVNEFYSSQEAALRFPDAPLDSASAAVILQTYIDQQ